MTHILLPTDFSENAKSAILYTLALYSEQECTFYILNSNQLKASRISSFSNKLLTTMRDNSLRDLQKLKEELETLNENSKHTFETILSLEDLDDAIDTVLEKYTIDLVVMGTKGATGAKEVLFGSNTTKMFTKVRSCPVLAIPNNYEFVVPTQIAFPSDFNRLCDAKELQYLKNLADLHNSKIRIIHINEEKKLSETQEQNMSILQQYLKDYDHSFHWVPNYADKETAIHDFIEELEIEMLAMVNYSHNFMERIFREPVIKKIGFHIKVPFLVIPE
ncbi:universal stress protein [Kordia zhangzhouensis]|uniref:universal stress protein n=1 Tax=Kordia zhangzhouensis TaxID=1620405 RepID=UPI0006299A52|nr:universal stress protein [Kordia zhangzhouensis]